MADISGDTHKKMTLCSLFDGSGGFCLGAKLAGIIPVESSEIEPFPVLVTHKRLPEVKHYGDVSKLKGGDLEPVDIITFGSPCQDLSIAGKRAGLDGARSGLFHQAIRIIKEMREVSGGEKPRYAVYENVEGALSSNDGDDFRRVLEEICQIKDERISVPRPDGRWSKAGEIMGDGFSVAWRVLDAAGWGVPQRRKRIYLVADFAGQSAGEVLFVSEGLSGYSAEGFRAWQGASRSTEEGIGEAGRYCLNTQGQSGVTVTDGQAGTLIAQDHGNHPAVLQAAGFSTEHSAQSFSIGYGEEVSPTLRATQVPAAMAIENHPTDSRVKISGEGVVQTLTERMGTGGGNVPLVAEPVTLKIRSGKPGGGKGPLWQNDRSATLGTHNDQTLFQPAYGIGKEAFSSGLKAAFNFSIDEELCPTLQTRGPGAVAEPVSRAFGVCSRNSKGMLSDNPKVGFYEAETSRTLDQKGGDPSCAQGGICILSPALSAEGAEDRATYSATTGSFMNVDREKASPLCARDWKDPQIVNVTQDTGEKPEPMYIVRRLTPNECARLQGFPDFWCSGLAIPEPADDELAFWMDVWDTWQKLNGKKPRSEKQIRKWLADPHSDAAEYKMWGNGVSLPIVFFVLSGIAWAAGIEDFME